MYGKLASIANPDTADSLTLKYPNVVDNQGEGYVALLVDTDMIASAKAKEYSAVANEAFITPPEGYKVCVRGIYIRTNGNTGTASLDFLTSEKVVDRVYFSAQNNSFSSGGHISGAIDEVLTINVTGTGTNKVFVRVNYAFHK